MTETKKGPWDLLTSGDLMKATDEELDRLKTMTDNDLLRSSRSFDLFAVVESTRRLKEALHKEEKAIKRLTLVLVILTVILVIVALPSSWWVTLRAAIAPYLPT